MTTTKTIRNRAKRNIENERWHKYLAEREKETMFPLNREMALELGDIKPGEMVTMPEFFKICVRLAEKKRGAAKSKSAAKPTTEPIPEASAVCTSR